MVAVRLVFNIVGMVAVYGLGLGFFFAASEAFPNGQLNTAAYPLFAGCFGVVTVISVLVTAWGTHHLIPSLSAPAESQGHTAKKLLLEVMDALQNLSFRWLLIGWIIVSAPIGVGSSLALYLNTFFLAGLAARNDSRSRPESPCDGYRLYVRTGIESIHREKTGINVGCTRLGDILDRTCLPLLCGVLPGAGYKWGCHWPQHLQFSDRHYGLAIARRG